MAEDADKAKLYRKRADELRDKAKTLSDFDARDSMIAVAVSYEMIADSLERIEATKRSLGLLKD